jgi:hypothetical protein
MPEIYALYDGRVQPGDDVLIAAGVQPATARPQPGSRRERQPDPLFIGGCRSARSWGVNGVPAPGLTPWRDNRSSGPVVGQVQRLVRGGNAVAPLAEDECPAHLELVVKLEGNGGDNAHAVRTALRRERVHLRAVWTSRRGAT